MFTRACSRVLRKSDRSSHLVPDTESRKRANLDDADRIGDMLQCQRKDEKSKFGQHLATHQNIRRDHVRRNGQFDKRSKKYRKVPRQQEMENKNVGTSFPQILVRNNQCLLRKSTAIHCRKSAKNLSLHNGPLNDLTGHLSSEAIRRQTQSKFLEQSGCT